MLRTCVCGEGGRAWARARARAWAARFGLALGPLARARAEVARANTRCSQDTSPLVLHAFGLHSATPRSPRSPLRARVRGSCSGLGLGTRGSRSGSYSYSGLALDRTLGRCDRNNPVALRAFRIQQPALGDRWPRALRVTRGRSPGRSSRCGGRRAHRHSRPPMPALGPSEGDVNEKLEKTEEEIGQTEAVEKKGKMLQEEVCDRRRLQKEAGMRSPPLIVWRTCHQTETHSARRSLHKYWRTQKKRESRLFLGWLIPAGRRKINSNFERMLPTTP